MNNDFFLISASLKGDINQVSKIISEGIDVNTRGENSTTALICAAFSGHNKIVQLLIENKAEINLKDNSGMSALAYASFWGKTEIIETLIKAGADTATSTVFGNEIMDLVPQSKKASVELLLQDIDSSIAHVKGDLRSDDAIKTSISSSSTLTISNESNDTDLAPLELFGDSDSSADEL